MGRRPYSEPRTRVNIYIREKLLTEFNLVYFDPVRGKASYGELSRVVNDLLENHLHNIGKERKARNGE